jgi:hypothetical protein
MRPGAAVAAIGPLAVWGWIVIAAPAHHLAMVFAALAFAAGLVAFTLPRGASTRQRLAAAVGSTTATLTAVVGIVINFIVLISWDACPGDPNQAARPLYAVVTSVGVTVSIYLLASWLLLRNGRSPLLLPLATIAAWTAVAIAYVVLASIGLPHHCYT